MFTIRPLKRCPKCGETKPATREFWYYTKGVADLCASWCRECRVANKYPRKRRSPGRYVDRNCEGCGREFRGLEYLAKSGGARFCSISCANRTREQTDLTERFWSKVDKSGPVPSHMPHLGQCWVWTACKGRGYGRIGVGGRSGGTVTASRVAWQLQHGTEPGELCVLHHCDNPGCVRGSHLFLGTRLDNKRDEITKGRALPPPHVMGSRQGGSRLVESQVEELRRRLAAGESGVALAREFGVGNSTVSRIRRGTSWRHVP